MIKHFIYTLMSGIHRDRGIKRIHMMENKLRSREVRFAIPFVYKGSGYFRTIEPRQNPVEIELLYKEVCKLTPDRVLEIGTARGGTLYLWTQAASDTASIVSVDLPGGDFGGAYPACRMPFYQAFAGPRQNLRLLRCDSHEKQTLEKVKDLFENKPVDFVFIDGDHTYEGIKADFRFYGPLVRTGGLVAFHDILPRQDLPGIQVDRFWNEIRDRFDTEEFIGPVDSGKKRIGIGLIRVGRERIPFIEP